jgi:glyoxylase-like metal-dependent hydrolase (beta-lactamase superfamily II)
MQNTIQNVTRRSFLAQASYLSAIYAVSSLIPLRPLAGSLAGDSRISANPIVDKGFASVRKIGNGLYATISDTSKGLQTVCNGGFLAGSDGAMLLEGYVSPAGAKFQMETLQSVSQVPIRGALDTHYHYDHSLGNAFYGANGVPLWSHTNTPKRIYETYGMMQQTDKAAFLAPFEQKVKDAKTEAAKKHAAEFVGFMTNMYTMVNSNLLTLPSHPIDAARLPMKVDLGGLTAIVETYPGHTGTDLIVRVPEQNVVYAGDLLFNGIFPVTFDAGASVSGWRATMKTFASWDRDTIFVPGHGQLATQKEVQLFRDMFDDIAEQAEKMNKSGVPVEDAVDQYVIPDRFKGVSPFAWYISIGPTIAKLYAEWKVN